MHLISSLPKRTHPCCQHREREEEREGEKEEKKKKREV